LIDIDNEYSKSKSALITSCHSRIAKLTKKSKYQLNIEMQRGGTQGKKEAISSLKHHKGVLSTDLGCMEISRTGVRERKMGMAERCS
jgi:hypothetical protein